MSFVRFELILLDGYFFTYHTKQIGWTHIVLNYIGPNDGEGIRFYKDGAEVASVAIKSGGPYSAGDGRIVVGRVYTEVNGNFASVQFDELIYFNAALTDADVQSIYYSA